MSTPLALLSETKLKLIRDVAEKRSLGSWERGCLSQALLELNNPELTPFFLDLLVFPDAKHGPCPDYLISPTDWVRANRPSMEDYPAGHGKALLQDSSVSDPLSLGIACLLRGMWEGDSGEDGKVGWREMVKLGFEWVEEYAPRGEDGCLSHRTAELSYWVDFIYMFPPTAAYHALTFPSHDPAHRHYLSYAYEQCRLYRKHCKRDQDGLWKHIVLGELEKIDPWPWATGVGWVGEGLVRVLATIKKSPLASEFGKECKDLQIWVEEILDSTNKHVTPSGMVRNYVDEPDMFEESCGTAILAAAAYRLAQMKLNSTYIPFAERARQAIYANIDEQGYLRQVCAIDDERKRRTMSPEGQSMVLMMEAAVRDWQFATWS